jgi:16S rRNA (adenine1518-N6/adenine1519-N6)-dimethyltransferase
MAQRARGRQTRPPLGQHFLCDRRLLARQIAYAEVRQGDAVLEIGPGPGVLTEALLQAGARVTAIEKDRRFHDPLAALQRRFADLDLVWGDALKVALPVIDKVVANLPYGAALPLTYRLLQQRFERAVLMYQHSLAERICAGPGERGYGRLGIAIGRLAETQLLETVGPAAFSPPPAVDSALVLLRRTRPRFAVPDEEFFRLVLEALFAHRDGELGQALASAAIPGVAPAALQAVQAQLPHRLRTAAVHRVSPRDFGRVCRLVWAAAAAMPPSASPRSRSGRRPAVGRADQARARGPSVRSS